MSDRVHAPTADEIEARFRSGAVRTARPLILGGLRVGGMLRHYRWTTSTADRLPTSDEPFILASNHASHADTAAILGTLPGRLRARTCVAAALDVFGPSEARPGSMASLRRECLQLVVAAGFRAFAFDRHGPPLRSLRTTGEMVHRGWNVLLYPEGTRSRTGSLGGFKPGVGILARTTGRPVVPVHVANGPAVLPCGAAMPRSGHIVVTYGVPMHCGAGERSEEFAERLRQRVIAMAPDAESLVEVEPALGPRN